VFGLKHARNSCGPPEEVSRDPDGKMLYLYNHIVNLKALLNGYSVHIRMSGKPVVYRERMTAFARLLAICEHRLDARAER